MSPPLPDRLVIATRASQLALWQARHVRQALQKIYPACEVGLLELTTRGDQILDRTLSKVGGKGLFVKELETALQDGRADLAVHSLKDVPVELPPDFELAVVTARADPRDALVSARYASLAEMPSGAVVGTSSLRREAQIRARYPRLVVRPLRGNVNTRLGKLDAGDFDAIILAAAGLVRLDLAGRIRQRLEPPQWLPAPAQGALAVECRNDHPLLLECLSALDDADTRCCVETERAMNRALGGSCHVPVGAYAHLHGGRLRLDGVVGSANDGRQVRASGEDALSAGEALGQALARQLLEAGAGEFLTP